MFGVVRCAMFAIVVATAWGQEPLASGVTRYLGGGSQVVWFEKGGTVWLTDGTLRGTRDTGVQSGSYSLAGDRLVVYRATRIDWLNPDGTSTVLTPPVAFEGYDDDAPSPTIWRTVLRGLYYEFIEVWRWSPSGWSSRIAGVQSQTAASIAVYRRPNRHLVHWFSTRPSELLSDLLREDWVTPWIVVDLDYVERGALAWSAGLLFQGFFNSSGRNAVLSVVDRGPVQLVLLPYAWGPYQLTDYSAIEPTPGFPFVAHRYSPRLLSFLTSNSGDFAAPPGAIQAAFWTSPAEQILVLSEQAGSRSVFWLDRAFDTWRATSGFGAPTGIQWLGNHGGASYVSITSAGGTTLAAYDEASHVATHLATGLRSITPGIVSFGAGFVFAADDGVHGSEPWISDGSAVGTRAIADLRAGPGSSGPRGFLIVGDRLVFLADSTSSAGVWGMEPQHLEWKRNPSNGRFYRRSSRGSWTAARSEARNLGGELATIRDAGEQLWITSAFPAENLWIGLNDSDRNGVFAWSSGEPFSYSNWCPGQPDRGPGETVVHIASYAGYCQGGWNDQVPSNSFAGIVERDGPPRPVEEFGAGCSQYVPQPVAGVRWTGGWPRPGGTVDLEVELGLGFVPTGLLLLSADATEYSGVPLPFELSALGAPNCFLHVRPDDVLVQWGGYLGAPWTWQMPASIRLPNDSALQGVTFFVQALAFEHPFRGLRTTNALRITIGV